MSVGVTATLFFKPLTWFVGTAEGNEDNSMLKLKSFFTFKLCIVLLLICDLPL